MRLWGPGHKGGLKLRPTSDRAREALFNILRPEVLRGALVLDLFAGTGALGLEALSRGAREAVFVDGSTLALGLIKKNIAQCGFSERTRVLRRDLLKGRFFLSSSGLGGPFNLLLMDPPYRQQICHRLLPELSAAGLIAPAGLVVCEESQDEELPEEVPGLRVFDQRRYGDTGFWFYRQGLKAESLPISD